VGVKTAALEPVATEIAVGDAAGEDVERSGEDRVLAGCTTYLCVSEAQLCNRDAMGHIDRYHGRFRAIMPNTCSEVGELGRFIAASTPVWIEVLRRPGKRIDDPEEVFCATPALTVVGGLPDRVDPLEREDPPRRGSSTAGDREGAHGHR